MKKLQYLLILSLAAVVGCSDITDVDIPEPETSEFAVTDTQATPRTQHLLKNIRRMAASGKTMFGHQCSTLYGVGWNGDADRSDVKSVCGDYPAVMGWDLSEIELDKESWVNIDGDSFEAMRRHIIAAYERGGVTTISWHATNPVTGGTSWDNTSAVGRILPGKDLHEKFCGWLDRVADYIGSLKTASGEAVPVLFRPYHEHTGSGFWWGKGNCTRDEYIALWQFTVQYLRDTKGLHNILYVYSPDIVSSYDSYLECYPGDEYVDILGLDAYDRPSQGWSIKTEGLRLIRMGRHISNQRNKPFAFTETGLENNKSDARWWTETLYTAIKGLPVAYVVVWRNAGENHFFGPYPNCVSEQDFKDFIALDQIVTESQTGNIYE